MTEITGYNFEVPKQGVVIIDFWAEWCAPCRMLMPILEKLSAEMTNVQFFKVNVEDKRGVVGLVAQYEITALPTLIVFVDGIKREVMRGYQSESTIRASLNNALKSLKGE